MAKVADLLTLLEDGRKNGMAKYMERVIETHGIAPDSDASAFWASVRDTAAFFAPDKMPEGWPALRKVAWVFGALLRLVENAEISKGLADLWGGEEAVQGFKEELCAAKDAHKVEKRRRGVEEELPDLSSELGELIAADLEVAPAACKVATWAVRALAETDPRAYQKAILLWVQSSKEVPVGMRGILEKLLKTE